MIFCILSTFWDLFCKGNRFKFHEASYEKCFFLEEFNAPMFQRLCGLLVFLVRSRVVGAQ